MLAMRVSFLFEREFSDKLLERISLTRKLFGSGCAFLCGSGVRLNDARYLLDINIDIVDLM